MSRIAVTVSCNDTAITIESEDIISPDLLDDMCRRASSTLVATIVQMLAVVED